MCSRMLPAALVASVVLCAVVLRPASAQETCVIRSVGLVGPGLVHLDCGQFQNVQVMIRVEKTLQYQGMLTVRLWADDSYFDDLLSVQTVNVPPGPPQDQEIAVNFPVLCEQQMNGRCVFGSDVGMDDDDGADFSHRVYATVGGKASLRCRPHLRSVTFYCDKPNGSVGCRPASASPGTSLVTAAQLSGNNVPVRQIELHMRYDPTVLSTPTVAFTQEFIQGFPTRNLQVLVGVVVITGATNNPTFVNGPIASMQFPVYPSAQPGETYFQFDPTSSYLRGPGGAILDTGMGVTSQSIVPPDNGAPLINTHLLTFTRQGLFGAPGAIQDENIWIPGWTGALLGYACGGAYEQVAGAVTMVNPDGSFQIPGPFANGRYRLMAVDLARQARMVSLDQLTDVVPGAAGGETSLLVESANPSSRGFELRFEAPGQEPVSLSIVDATGREVARLLESAPPGEGNRVLWDGRDGGGGDAPSGVYFARLRCGERSTEVKLILAR